MAKKKGRETESKITVEWDPNLKEPWLLELEKQPVNDERWTCLVTSAIPAKIEDDECLQIYKQRVALGLQKSFKTISMSDVINIFKETGNPTKSKTADKKPKGEKAEKSQKREEKPPSPRFTQIKNLMIKYASFNEFECNLHPYLLAVLIKYMILKMKENNIREQKIHAVRQRKIRERNLKGKFIRDLKPFEANTQVKKEHLEECSAKEDQNDPQLARPDLYIMLTDFFDISCYPELLRINIPFVAFLKITYPQSEALTPKFNPALTGKTNADTIKEIAVDEFWKKLKESCVNLEKTLEFKDVILMKFTPTRVFKQADQKELNSKMIFDEMSWMQCAAYRIYCQHQKYLQQLYVQELSLSLEPLDLSKCEVYNLLCDALITGQPLTPMLVLYAMVEQLVVGVPETESVMTEFDKKVTNFFATAPKSIAEETNGSNDSTVNLLTPCLQCRNKEYNYVCDAFLDGNLSTEKSERTISIKDKEVKEREEIYPSTSSLTKLERKQTDSSDYAERSSIFRALIEQVLREKKKEKEIRKEKKWSTPRLCFYGDSVTLQTYHCDRRIIDPDQLVHRFMENADIINIWSRYPELPPGERAFYNFHYNTLLKISQEKEETLRLKIFFTFLAKIAGTSKFYHFKGEEENLSSNLSVNWKNKQGSLPKSKFLTTLLQAVEKQHGFSNYVFGSFVVDLRKHHQKNIASRRHFLNKAGVDDRFTNRGESHMYLAGNRSSVSYNPHNFLNLESLPQTNTSDKIKDILLPILDCLEISTISDFNFIKQFEGFSKLIEKFTYYEKLKPALMIQRLLKYREEYNTIHCTYFPPTDSVAIFMHNDSDHRGIFYRVHSGKLWTPVAFRDFYNYVYPEINDWIAEETTEHAKFVSNLKEKEKAKEEKKDEEFLTKLKLHYCGLNESARKEFLQQKIDYTLEPEVMENELQNLPHKIATENPSKNLFVVTNLGSLRIETSQKVHEFHSKDGTQVQVVFESWLYNPSLLLILTIKRSPLKFRYYVGLRGEDRSLMFTLKTASDIIILFFKETETSMEDSTSFNVRISWPIGLLIEVKFISNSSDSNGYIKQSYIKAYRRGWEIEEEKWRCYLKNGDILIFKETGEIKILTKSGVIHTFYYDKLSRCETITMTGEVWQQRIGKTSCRKRRKISAFKVYAGVDSKTQETYYKRDDGTSCMLWPNGKLVVNYPDGTKITSTPDFDECGVKVDWNDEEKEYFLELESKRMEEMGRKSRTSMRSRSVSPKSVKSDEFTSVSCTYLMEHPKYATVFCETNSSMIEIRMMENLSVKTFSRWCYEVQKNSDHLIVKGNHVQFNRQCNECENSSTAVLDFNSNILCHCVDFFKNEFVVHKNGETVFHENIENTEDLTEDNNMSSNLQSSCLKDHAINMALKQKCFVLERDLSGLEFIHEDYIAHFCYDLPDDTYYDLNTDDPNAISHTFSSSLTKVDYETWVMDYEKNDSLPTNLKKSDIKSLEIKENRNKLFRYPFPQNHVVEKFQKTLPRQKINMPKVKLVRIIKCLPLPGPKKVISDICEYVGQYQKEAHDICLKYEKHINVEELFNDANYVKMRLKKIAVSLSQNLNLYPHVCSQLPSTDKDIHYFGHLINAMEDMKGHFHNNYEFLPQCKQIPRRLPRISDFPAIREEVPIEHYNA